jgi:hypothetical protein
MNIVVVLGGLAINAAVRYLPMLLVNKRDKKIDDILS